MRCFRLGPADAQAPTEREHRDRGGRGGGEPRDARCACDEDERMGRKGSASQAWVLSCQGCQCTECSSHTVHPASCLRVAGLRHQGKFSSLGHLRVRMASRASDFPTRRTWLALLDSKRPGRVLADSPESHFCTVEIRGYSMAAPRQPVRGSPSVDQWSVQCAVLHPQRASVTVSRHDPSRAEARPLHPSPPGPLRAKRAQARSRRGV